MSSFACTRALASGEAARNAFQFSDTSAASEQSGTVEGAVGEEDLVQRRLELAGQNRSRTIISGRRTAISHQTAAWSWRMASTNPRIPRRHRRSAGTSGSSRCRRSRSLPQDVGEAFTLRTMAPGPDSARSGPIGSIPRCRLKC